MKPYTITHSLRTTNGVVYNSPHSGTYFPEHFLENIIVEKKLLESSGDTLVDQLIRQVDRHGSQIFINHYARSYVDTNRAPNEIDPAMFTDIPPKTKFFKSEKVMRGFGVIPRRAYDGTPIYAAPLPFDCARHRLTHIYHPIHQALSDLLQEVKQQAGYYLLVDCHSMPSYPFIGSRLPAHTQPDVVLGNYHGKSCQHKISAFIEKHFSEHGLTVAFNNPYAGGYNTVHYGNPHRKEYAIQIEINRKLYIDEKTLMPHDGFIRIQTMFTELAQKLNEELPGLMSGKT
ncbi:N-formylglutamate amidohydrolase [Luteithermobacter gelatinilyticus]|uniref:N-formylglutamate amidohydrolase n=1 Tax=Luteithermobacter gelatinilyticus TaxID=2582913 RepID=UPI00110648FE|nr:N-formylglutamate amidohydrolase [Luteithermobacter gelatinilyticus]